MKVSYLITCCTETKTLENLLYRVFGAIDEHNDEIILLIDSKHPIVLDDIYPTDGSIKEETASIIYNYSNYKNVKIISHPLENNYGTHKNFGIENCKGDFIFQIDGDELPTENIIGKNLHTIIENNPDIEAFAVPRINDFKGVTQEHAKRWGWRLTPSTSIIHEKTIDTNSEEYKFLKNEGYILEETEIH